jgi:hypothetical protein
MAVTRVISAPLKCRTPPLECPVCLLSGDQVGEAAEAVRLAGNPRRPAPLHGGRPTTVIRWVGRPVLEEAR